MKIAVDLGGTKIRVAAVEDGAVVSTLCERTNSEGTETEVLEQIDDMISGLMLPSVDGIGVGIPSVVDAQEGIVYDVIGIPSWKEVHLREHLEERFGVRAAVNNDCNCFALGASLFGPAKGCGEVVCVTLGTGVGSSLVVDGHLYGGHNTGAGEIGNIPYLDRDYEFYCSSRFFPMRGTTGIEAERKAREGDPEALKLWTEFGHNVGMLVKLIMNAFDPEIIVFGGSLSKAYGLFEDAMREAMEDFPYHKSIERLSIKRADTEDMSVLGAASLV